MASEAHSRPPPARLPDGQGKQGHTPLPVCLVEYNPLAARYLHRLLDGDAAFQLLSHSEVFEARRRSKLPVAVFLLDRATLPSPLSKFLRFLRVRFPEARILVLDHPQPPPELFRLLFLGIQGFLSYPEVEEALAPALRAVADGRLWVAPEVLAQFRRYTSALSDPKAARGEALSRQERRIIALVQRRLSNKEISSILGIGETTVKSHLSNIFAKLGVSDRRSVVELASSHPPRRLLPQKPK